MPSKISLLITLIYFGVSTITAQNVEPEYKAYKWTDDPVLSEISEEEREGNYLILKDKLLVEYVYESSGDLVMYETRHMIVRINNEKGIEARNKVYIPSGDILEEINLKARTITSKGEVIQLPSSAVKKVDNLENAGPYIIFAMEGVDVGSEIEYLYTNKKNARLQRVQTLQSDKIVKNVNIDVYSPENLIFEAKGYNGCPDFIVDSITNKRNHIHVSIEEIDALEDEKYAAYEANRMFFQCVFSNNTERNSGRAYTWENMGLDLYNALFVFQKNETKAIDKLIAKLKLTSLENDEKKIRALETYLKTNLDVNEAGGSMTIDQMLQLKYGSEMNMQRIYIAAAKQLNIPVQLVLTTNRMEKKFDKDFPTWSSLQEYLLYFPSVKMFLSANNFFSRLGFPTPQYTGQDGLFIKETSIGDITTSLSKVKEIPFSSVDKSFNDIEASVSFDLETFTPTINMKHIFSGYSAFYTQPAIPYLDDNKKEELIDELAHFIGEEVTVKSAELSGDKQEDILVNPFIISCVLEAPHLVENTNDKYIFKLGELIGPQEEMYQEKKRQLPAEVTYTHSYHRVLEIKIPEGYKVNNLEDIIIDKKLNLDGKDVAYFVSTYSLDGDVLKVDVKESYSELFYPLENFDKYREVINAAADFNKIAIILEKK